MYISDSYLDILFATNYLKASSEEQEKILWDDWYGKTCILNCFQLWSDVTHWIENW